MHERFQPAVNLDSWLSDPDGSGSPLDVHPDSFYDHADLVTVIKAAFADPEIIRPAERRLPDGEIYPVEAGVSLHADEGDGSLDGYFAIVAVPGQPFNLASNVIRPGNANGLLGSDFAPAILHAVDAVNAMLTTWDDIAHPYADEDWDDLA